MLEGRDQAEIQAWADEIAAAVRTHLGADRLAAGDTHAPRRPGRRAARAPSPAMIRLSVNVNKVATLRNSRGGDVPSRHRRGAASSSTPVPAASPCIRAPTSGTSRRRDVRDIAALLAPRRGLGRIQHRRRSAPGSAGARARGAAAPVHAGAGAGPARSPARPAGRPTRRARRWPASIATMQAAGIRVSLFVDPDPDAVAWAADLGADRVELYTEPFARAFERGAEAAAAGFAAYAAAAERAHALRPRRERRPRPRPDATCRCSARCRTSAEVSIGHALMSRALFVGLRHRCARVPGGGGGRRVRRRTAVALLAALLGLPRGAAAAAEAVQLRAVGRHGARRDALPVAARAGAGRRARAHAHPHPRRLAAVRRAAAGRRASTCLALDLRGHGGSGGSAAPSRGHGARRPGRDRLAGRAARRGVRGDRRGRRVVRRQRRRCSRPASRRPCGPWRCCRRRPTTAACGSTAACANTAPGPLLLVASTEDPYALRTVRGADRRRGRRPRTAALDRAGARRPPARPRPGAGCSAWWTGCDGRCYSDPRGSRRPRPHARRLHRFRPLRHPVRRHRRLDPRQPAGGHVAARCRGRPAAAAAAPADGRAPAPPLDEARAQDAGRRRRQRAHQPGAARAARQPVLRRRALHRRRAVVRGRAAAAAQGRQRLDRPRRGLLLHQPARQGDRRSSSSRWRSIRRTPRRC